MTLTQEQLEWIVSEVVRRLRSAGYGESTAKAAPQATLELTDRLVTLDTLNGKLQGVAQVRVGSRAIVTPAVVDHLKERKIEFIRG